MRPSEKSTVDLLRDLAREIETDHHGCLPNDCARARETAAALRSRADRLERIVSQRGQVVDHYNTGFDDAAEILNRPDTASPGEATREGT